MSKSRGILTVRLSTPEIEQLERLAAERGYTLSEFVRVVLRRTARGTYRIAPKVNEAAVLERTA